MKLICGRHIPVRSYVAPLAGAWIEMHVSPILASMLRVAPLAGAWIEIDMRETHTRKELVAPLAGAWIEIGYARI